MGNRAAQLSRVVFGVLIVATFFAFFAAQRLKHTDPLVYSVSFKRFISPNDDGFREKGRVRFRIKKADYVTVEVVDRTGSLIRVLADDEKLGAGPHTFYWNGRFRGFDGAGVKQRGRPVPDGAYRVRITLRNNGRSFVPDQFFVVDTVAPLISADVTGGHSASILRGRRPVRAVFAGSGTSQRAQFLVYRVRGQRAIGRPVAAFLSVRGSDAGFWDQSVGRFTRWDPKLRCQGIVHRGRARPAPVGAYVIVARACDAAGNVGSSSRILPPRAGSTRGRAGITLTGVQIAPALQPVRAGGIADVRLAPPSGGYRWRLSSVEGARVASGRARGPELKLRTPRELDGLFILRVSARRPLPGDRGIARTPLVIAGTKQRPLLIAQPSISWQAANPVDVNGDGFADSFAAPPDGVPMRVPLDRFLASPFGPPGFNTNEGALERFLDSRTTQLDAQTTTDAALAADPAAALRGRRALLFSGDERWITPQLGTALRAFVERGGRVAFFSSDAFRRTLTISPTTLSGPSPRRQRDIFGEAIEPVTLAPAPVIAFKDQLGLLHGPTGLFKRFEQSQQLADGAVTLTSAGRQADRPALIGYRLGHGIVIRVGVPGWPAELAVDGSGNLAWTTNAILEVLRR